MNRKRVLYLGVGATALAAVLALRSGLEQTVFAQARGTTAPAAGAQPVPPRPSQPPAASAPTYRVQPFWPQPLPFNWVLGAISGVTVDSKNHVWVVHRGPNSIEGPERAMNLPVPTSRSCCVTAPSVIEFDAAGRVVSHFGGPEYGYSWPQSTGGIAVDGQGNVWIAAYGLDPAPAGRGRGAAPAAAPPVATPGAGAAPAPAPPAGGDGRGRGGRGGAGTTTAPATTAPSTTAPAPAAQAPGRGRGAADAAPVVADAHVLKYAPSGRELLTIGTPGQPGAPDSRTGLNRPSGIAVDDAANEVYIADSGNHRIVVFNSNTGAFVRQWGGSGEAPTAAGAGAYDPNAAPARQFRDPTCVKIAKDGMVYVCDRTSNRIQVFQKNGTYVKEMVIAKDTGGATTNIGSMPLNSSGSVWDVAFSSDAQQRWLFVADGHNKKIRVLRRETLAEVAAIGGGGRQVGRFLAPGSVAVDAQGNLYTGEQHATKRVQKFAPAR